jgi:RHS repeat-associated protein
MKGLSGVAAAMRWAEVYAGSRHLATYDTGTNATYFAHNDWQGTERVRTTVSGISYETCSNLPYGDGLQCAGGADISPIHYTGKERDTESGLDYFGARYFSSGLGRWMSPDWAAKPTAVPYAQYGDPQSLNLYGFVTGNPVSKQDGDGHLFVSIYHQSEVNGGGQALIENFLAVVGDQGQDDITNALQRDEQKQKNQQTAQAQQQTSSSTANANPNAAAEHHQYDLVVERTNKLLGTDDAADHIDPNGTLHGGNYAFGINENDKSDAAFKSALNKALGEADDSAGAHGGLTPPTHRVGFSTSLHHDNDALHVDHFNGATFPIGTLLHAIVDVGIGSAFYGSTRAFSYAGVQ